MMQILDMAKEILRTDELPTKLQEQLTRWWTLFCRVGGGTINPAIVALICEPYLGQLEEQEETQQIEPQDTTQQQPDIDPIKVYNDMEGDRINVKWRFGRIAEAKLLGYTTDGNAKVLIRGQMEPTIIRRANIVEETAVS